MRKSKFYRKFKSAIDYILSSADIIIIGALVTVIIYGSVGCFLLRTQFIGIKSFNDAFYYSIVVFSTLGDNQMIPITPDAKYFVISMVILGIGTFAMSFSVIFYRIMNHLQKVVRKIQGGKIHMRDHVVICGYGVITELLINKFINQNKRFVLLDNNQHPEISIDGNTEVLFVSVPGRIENLIKANIETCKVFIASADSDSENILATHKAFNLKQKFNADFKIVTRILYEENIEAAERTGADHVISPSLMAANAIINLT